MLENFEKEFEAYLKNMMASVSSVETCADAIQHIIDEDGNCFYIAEMLKDMVAFMAIVYKDYKKEKEARIAADEEYEEYVKWSEQMILGYTLD